MFTTRVEHLLNHHVRMTTPEQAIGLVWDNTNAQDDTLDVLFVASVAAHADDLDSTVTREAIAFQRAERRDFGFHESTLADTIATVEAYANQRDDGFTGFDTIALVTMLALIVGIWSYVAVGVAHLVAS